MKLVIIFICVNRQKIISNGGINRKGMTMTDQEATILEHKLYYTERIKRAIAILEEGNIKRAIEILEGKQ